MGLKDAAPAKNTIGVGDIEVAADLLKSLANPQRLMIVCALTERERGVSDLERELGIHQPSLSQHLASLREAGVITARRQAKAVFYRIIDRRASLLVEVLSATFGAPPHRKSPNAASFTGSTGQIATTTSLKRVPNGSEAAFFARIGESAEM